MPIDAVPGVDHDGVLSVQLGFGEAEQSVGPRDARRVVRSAAVAACHRDRRIHARCPATPGRRSTLLSGMRRIEVTIRRGPPPDRHLVRPEAARSPHVGRARPSSTPATIPLGLPCPPDRVPDVPWHPVETHTQIRSAREIGHLPGGEPQPNHMDHPILFPPLDGRATRKFGVEAAARLSDSQSLGDGHRGGCSRTRTGPGTFGHGCPLTQRGAIPLEKVQRKGAERRTGARKRMSLWQGVHAGHVGRPTSGSGSTQPVLNIQDRFPKTRPSDPELRDHSFKGARQHIRNQG